MDHPYDDVVLLWSPDDVLKYELCTVYLCDFETSIYVHIKAHIFNTARLQLPMPFTCQKKPPTKKQRLWIGCRHLSTHSAAARRVCSTRIAETTLQLSWYCKLCLFMWAEYNTSAKVRVFVNQLLTPDQCFRTLEGQITNTGIKGMVMWLQLEHAFS